MGFVAALAVISEFENKKVPGYLIEIDKYVRINLNEIFNEYNFKINVLGMLTVPVLQICEENPLVVKTLLTQEMLKEGFLFSNVMYLSQAHSKEVVELCMKSLDKVCQKINRAKKTGSLKALLEGPVCHSTFQRLT